jgi:ATP-dependent exoDNAse (exonuclease V) alpha subunit
MLQPYLSKGLKLIFSGDPAQIPPVNEKDSLPLLKWKEHGILRCELNRVMRQAEGNPILEFATEIRSNYKEGRFNPNRRLLHDGSGIETVLYNSSRETEILQQYFDSKEFTEDPDYFKVIAWRNIAVDNYNRMIRRIIYKHESDLAAIMLGEKLIIDKPVVVRNKLLLATNEEVTVEELSVTDYKLRLMDYYGSEVIQTVKTYSVKISWWQDNTRKVYAGHIVHEDDTPRFRNMLDQMKEAARIAPPERKNKMWKQFFDTRDKFLAVKYNYAITGHKSQGSSYQQCLVLKWDIDMNRNIEERNRILYVACTRPRHKLYIEP